MKGLVSIFLFWGLLFAGLNSAVLAESPAAARQTIGKAGISQNLKHLLPLNLEFTNEAGETVKLSKFFDQNKPVILTPVYYECPMLCGLVLKGLLHSLQQMKFTVGRDFEIVTFSIDPREGPNLATQKKEKILSEYTQPGAKDGWHFLTSPGNEQPIKSLTEAVGFHYVYDKKSGQFAHPAMIVLATAEGRIARYFTGIQFLPRDLRLGIIEASEDRIANFRDQILLLCYHYDPSTGKYGLVIHRVLQAAGILTVLILAAFILLALRSDKMQLKGCGK